MFQEFNVLGILNKPTSFSDVPQMAHDLHSIHCQPYFFVETIIFGVNFKHVGWAKTSIRNSSLPTNLISHNHDMLPNLLAFLQSCYHGDHRHKNHTNLICQVKAKGLKILCFFVLCVILQQHCIEWLFISMPNGCLGLLYVRKNWN